MTMNRWHWLVATEMILAVSVAQEASAQQRGILQPAQETIVVSPAAACASPRRQPCVTVWNNWKGRLERWIVPEGPDAVPLGQSLYQTMTNQIDNGIAVRMILNDFDFEPCSPNLNQRGREKLGHLAGLAIRYPYPIIVERTNYDPALAKQRVEMTRKAVAGLSIPLAPNRIVEGGLLTPGLNGVEAWILNGNLMQQTQSQTSSGGGGGQTGGSFGTTGTSGGAQPNQTPGNQ